MSKICSKCKLEKELSNYWKDKTKASGYRPECKVCTYETQKRRPNRLIKMKEWRKNNKEYVKSHDLKTSFGITLDKYNAILIQQNYCCASCKRHQSSFKKKLAVDHDHLTGKVRGLLCSACNTALGLLKENIETMNSLIVYTINKGVLSNEAITIKSA